LSAAEEWTGVTRLRPGRSYCRNPLRDDHGRQNGQLTRCRFGGGGSRGERERLQKLAIAPLWVYYGSGEKDG
jgi:hypothetical protein